MGRRTSNHRELVRKEKHLKLVRKKKHFYTDKAFLVAQSNFIAYMQRMGVNGCLLRYPKISGLVNEIPMEKPTDSIDILNFTYLS